MPNVHDLIQRHTLLSITCLDRLYINGYVPTLQTSGQLCYFLKQHLGNPVPSPALLGQRHERFVREVKDFAERAGGPLVHFERKQRKDEVASGYRAKFEKPEGVVFVGVAQEKMSSFKARKALGPGGGVYFDFSRQPVAVNHYYFYVQDAQWGPGFVKVGSYAPYPVKLCLNGHEWAKQQLRREGIGFESLDNGFLSCEEPEQLQSLCDRLGPADVQGFFDRWSRRLPWPLLPSDREAGFEHKLSIWQMEVSLTQVFDQPVQGRHFFEEVIRDNLDLGRPERVGLLFPNKVTKRTPAPTHGYRTRVITQGVNPSLHVEYKRSHVKQYFKENQALRTETTINAPGDFGVNKGLENLGHLTLLRQGLAARTSGGGRAERERAPEQAWWQVGQRGSQVAMTRAKARRAVTKLSWKWRSGRAELRVVLCRPSGRGGKMPHAFGDNERIAAEDNGDMVMPPRKSTPFKVVEAEFALEVLVHAFGAPSLHHCTDERAFLGVFGKR